MKQRNTTGSTCLQMFIVVNWLFISAHTCVICDELRQLKNVLTSIRSRGSESSLWYEDEPYTTTTLPYWFTLPYMLNDGESMAFYYFNSSDNEGHDSTTDQSIVTRQLITQNTTDAENIGGLQTMTDANLNVNETSFSHYNLSTTGVLTTGSYARLQAEFPYKLTRQLLHCESGIINPNDIELDSHDMGNLQRMGIDRIYYYERSRLCFLLISREATFCHFGHQRISQHGRFLCSDPI